jgi:ATP synthase subunit 8
MPQLDPLSYMTQLIGWMSAMCLFYYFVIRTILPPLKTLQTLREWWIEEKEDIQLPSPQLSPVSIEAPELLTPLTNSDSTYINHLTYQLTKNETLRTI